MKKRLSAGQWLILGDLSVLPLAFLFRWLSGFMLGFSRPCGWTRFGGKCVACGGTHFVKALLSGQLAAAFSHNQFLFITVVLLVISWILLHLWIFFKVQFAKKVLQVLYSIPTLVIYIAGILAFLLFRNLPAIIHAVQLIIHHLNT